MSLFRNVGLLLAALATTAPTLALAQEPAPATGVLTKPPELLQFVEAPFPASEAGRTGSVVLAITIAADGAVEDAVVQTSSASVAFDEAAVAAAKQFVFSAAEVDGVPTRIRILYQYDFVEKVVAPTTAIFAGVVMDREEKVPIPGVTVTLGDGRQATTDADGRFRFEEVAPGAMTVTLEGERLTALQTEESFVAGEQLDATYEVFLTAVGEEGDDLEILVVAPTIKREAVSTEIAADDARKVPGTQGDVLRVVESMPGVARASLGTGALVVWGAAPGDTGVYVDGVPVPRLYHDGGLRSVVGSDFVKSVELVPGGYGSAYGRGVGGLVSVDTKRFDDRAHGSIAADVYDAAGSVTGPMSETVDVGVAGRYGYAGPLLGAFYPEVEDFFPIPNYYDAQARVGVKVGPNETLDLTGLISSDETRRTAPSPDPAREASEAKELDFQRVYLRYVKDAGDGSVTSATVFAGADQSSLVSGYGAVETSLETEVVLAGARVSHRARVAKPLTVESGLDVYVPQTRVRRYGSVAVPSREGDVRVFGQPPPDQISSDEFTVVAVDVAPYAEADLALLEDTLHLVPGVRFDPYARSVSRAAPQIGISPTNGLFVQDFQLEPRLSVRWSPVPAVTLTGAWGRYGQQPLASDLSASFGNPALPITTGEHRVLGASLRTAEVLTVALTGFHDVTDDLAMRNPAEQPATAQALVPSGEGRTYGVQSMIRLDPTKGIYGWISYTLSRSERKNALGRPWRPSDYDQPHVLTALAGYELPLGFEAGVRARLASGFPRSEVVGSFYDDRRDLYQPLFGDQNAIRLPTFFQVDARLAKHFDVGKSEVDASLEVQNVSNQVNVEEFIYDADYSNQGAIRGLPILPVVGLRWSF